MISSTAEYALRAVVALAQSDGHALVTPNIAERTRVPAGYLPKVLQALRRAGLVDSKRGLGGGFTLARPPEEISILMVVNAMDPVKRIERCPLGIASHGTNLCPLHRRLDRAAEAMERTFADTTISELLNVSGMSEPLCKVENEKGPTRLTIARSK